MNFCTKSFIIIKTFCVKVHNYEFLNIHNYELLHEKFYFKILNIDKNWAYLCFQKLPKVVALILP